MANEFSNEIFKSLGYYVYRLIDPRNGLTFYVGKGVENRVFQHVKDANSLLSDNINIDEEVDDSSSLKIKIINEIYKSGLEPLHVIHRHGMDEDVAFEVEAALIDAYFGLSNIMGGYKNNERGCKHSEEIIRTYSAKPLIAYEDLILIYIGKSSELGRDIYSAVRWAWRMSFKEASKRKLVLAYDGGLVIGAYRPEKWLPATNENFPELLSDFDSKRIGFIGKKADDVWDLYVGTRPPPRKKGTQTPFTYIDANG